ncbi:MAG: rhomboid family intramembrane serine protease [Burkholderiaceae bacterium]
MRAWSATCALLGAGAAGTWLAGPAAAAALVWEARGWMQAPWTLWTSAWVHFSFWHLAGNLLALAAIAVAGNALRAGRAASVALLLAWPAGTGLLSLWPAVTGYWGLSGPIHAAVGILWAWTGLQGIARPISFIIFGGMGLKLATERGWLRPIAFDPSWGFNIVYASHLSGALAGAAIGIVCTLLAGRRPAVTV